MPIYASRKNFGGKKRKLNVHNHFQKILAQELVAGNQGDSVSHRFPMDQASHGTEENDGHQSSHQDDPFSDGETSYVPVKEDDQMMLEQEEDDDPSNLSFDDGDDEVDDDLFGFDLLPSMLDGTNGDKQHSPESPTPNIDDTTPTMMC
jgi:hypothetical protein